MITESKQVVGEFLTAVKTLDLEKVGSLLAIDVNWIQPGNNEISGLKKSRDEVFAMVGKMFELSGNTLKLVAFNTVSENGTRIAGQLQWTAEKPSGEMLNVSNIDVYTVENGLITTVEIFSADQQQEDDFWKS